MRLKPSLLLAGAAALGIAGLAGATDDLSAARSQDFLYDEDGLPK